MSSLMQAIAGELGGSNLSSLAGAIGASPQQTQTAISVALPALIGGLAKNASQPDGAQALAGALDRDHQEPLAAILGSLSGGGGGGGGGLLGAAMGALGGGGGNSGGGGGLLGAAMGALGGGGGNSGGGVGSLLGAAMGMMGGGSQPAPKSLNGLGMLGHIFGSQQPKVEQGVAKASGLDAGMVAKLLPMLAPLVMNALGTMKKNQNMDAGQLAGFLGQEQTELSGKSPGGGILDALDQNGDGIGDDLLRIGMGVQQSGLLNGLFG